MLIAAIDLGLSCSKTIERFLLDKVKAMFSLLV